MKTKYPQYQKRSVLMAASEIIDGRVAVYLDVYDVLVAFGITNPAQQHAVKKILRAGNDHLSFEQDMDEVKDSLDRAVGLEKAIHSLQLLIELEYPEDNERIVPYEKFWSDVDTVYRLTLGGDLEGMVNSKWVKQDKGREWMEKHPTCFSVISKAEARKLVEEAGGVW